MPRPNILYIHSHDTGRYVQPYGHAIPTPNIQHLAEEGVMFRQAFCAGPTCSPSRAALLTGMSPHGSGMIGLAHRGFALNNYHQHIVHTLRSAGYFSALAGVQHVAADNKRIGYDALLDAADRASHGYALADKRAAEFLDNSPSHPFFLSVGFSETHRVFPEPDSDINPDYCLTSAPLPDTARTRADMAAFITSAKTLDRRIGIVLDALDRNGLAENTLVICTTDHGIAFPRMKCCLTDSGIGVMLIMRGPGDFDGGKVLDAMVSHVDVFPTICDLLEIDRPKWLEGKSVMPLITGAAAEINEEIFSEVSYHAAYEPKRCVRTKQFKYIRRFGGRATPVLPNIDDSPSKDVLMEQHLPRIPCDEEALYNLTFDPNETNNLANCPAMTPMLDEMRQRLQNWMERTGDPLLRGPVAAPSGAVVNDVDGVSPNEEPRPVV